MSVWGRLIGSRWSMALLSRMPPQRTSVRHLPLCTVDTNLPSQHVPKDFGAALCSLLAQMLNKPPEVRRRALLPRGNKSE